MENPRSFLEVQRLTMLSDGQFFVWMTKAGIIHSAQTCECGNPMELHLKESNIDGAIWQCSICRRTRSIRHGTIFSYFKIPMKKCLLIYAAWLSLWSIDDTADNTEVDNKELISELFHRFRIMAIQWYDRDLEEYPLGSTGGIVQIDETATGKAKYNRGKSLKRDCNWILGAIDVATSRIAVMHVEDRTMETLSAFVKQNVVPNSTIYSDQWRGYNDLSSIGYNHQTVNHKIQFVNHMPNGVDVHTQKIEATWKVLKDYFKRVHAHHRAYTDEYAKVFAARHNIGNKFPLCFNFIKVA